MVILHLSDLHFGSEKSNDAHGVEHRSIVLTGLLDCIKQQSLEWQPQIICISGDIGYAGKRSDYESASLWLKDLLAITGLTTNEIILCPGNHDVYQKERLIYPSNSKDADELLQLPVPKYVIDRFSEYITFCKSLGIPPLQIQREDNYLVGTRVINGLRFVSLNSAWFCKGKEDKNKLWIGQQHIISLEASGTLKARDRNETTITLVHHPETWLHNDETTPYGDSPRFSTFDYLAARCELILTGHTHGVLRKPNKIADSAWHVTAGASYDNSAHFNSFSLMKVEPQGFTLSQFEFNPRTTDGQNWSQKGGAKFFFFGDHPKPPNLYTKDTNEDLLVEIRQKSIEYAEREQEKKSRAIKGVGVLPHLINRNVSVFLQKEHLIIEDNGKIRANHSEICESLISAVKRNSRTLLLAELGAGKSTQATQLVKSIIEKECGVAFLVPAENFKGYSFKDTDQEIIVYISKLIKKLLHIEIDFDLINLLSRRIEVTIIIDGLDEIEPRNAKQLLEKLSDVVNQSAHIRIIATGRIGFNYDQWQLLGIAKVNEVERKQLFYNESISNGKSHEIAESEAKIAVDVLSNRKQLSIAASTPLFLRLLYPRLSEATNLEKYTLGDLLFDLLDERLIGWSARSSQDNIEEELEKIFPLKTSRLFLLAKAAGEISNGNITRFNLEHSFYEEFTKQTRTNPEVLASQVVSYLLRHILVEENGLISFPVQPLLECSLAVYYFEKLTFAEQEANSKIIHWRIASFMATFAKRLNKINQHEDWFSSYLLDVINNNKNIAAVSLIVVESESTKLAMYALTLFKGLGFRPIFLYGEDSEYLAECIARNIIMAGESAMDWFFSQYLDPTKPASDRTTIISGQIFSYWVKLSKANELSKELVTSLTNIIKPHSLIDYHRSNKILGPLALLLPNEFSPSHRAKLLINLLWGGALSVEAKKMLLKDVENGYKEDVSRELRNAAVSGSESNSIAALLWLELNQEKLPTTGILQAVIKGGYGKRKDQKVQKAWNRWLMKHHDSNMMAILRAWLISEDTDLASAAACVLYEMGSREWLQLAPALVKGLHDGGKNDQCETILGELIEQNGLEALEWLVEQFDSSEKRHNLPHSSEWRILLREFHKLEIPKPNWLCNAVSALGDFILSRNPDIRQSLTDLLNKQETPYLSELRKNLLDIDPNVRKRTACVLIAVFPDTEIDAMEIVLESDFEVGTESWENYFRRLKFGPSVLSYLKTHQHVLSSVGKVLSLVLLYRNGESLSESDWRTLLHGILYKHHYIDFDLRNDSPKKPILASAEAYSFMLEAIESSHGTASYAADGLLEYHSAKLSAEQEIRCKIIKYKYSDLERIFISERQRSEEDSQYYESVLIIGEEYTKVNKKESVISLIAQTIKDPSKWKTLIWMALFSNDSISSSVSEYFAEWLYKLAEENLEIQKQITQAVIEYHNDPRFNQESNDVNRYWLATVAHCFGNLDDIYIRDINTGYIPGELELCIVARLNLDNTLPKRNQKKLSVVKYGITNVTELDETLDQVLLNSDDIHPQFFILVESYLLYKGELTKENTEKYSKKGVWGCWFVTLINYYNQQSIDVSIILAAYMNQWFPLPRSQNEVITKRMVRARQSVFRYVSQNKDLKEDLISKLKEDLPWPSEIRKYSLLLTYSADLDHNEVLSMLECIATSDAGFDSEHFITLFVNWYVEKGYLYKDILYEGLQRGLTLMSINKPKFTSGILPRLVFPSALWMQGYPIDEKSVNIFLLGLHCLLISNDGNYRREINLEEAYQHIESIWRNIPGSVFQQVFIVGSKSKFSDVRAICRLLFSLFRPIANGHELEDIHVHNWGSH